MTAVHCIYNIYFDHEGMKDGKDKGESLENPKAEED